MPATFLGVRHHSPACARLVARAIDELRPAYVLVEGPADMNGRLDELLLGHELPVAVFSHYRDTERVFSSWTPLCDYSPEWVALYRGRQAGAETLFIDLPAWHAAFTAENRANRYADAEARYAEAMARLFDRFEVGDSDALWDRLFEAAPDDGLAERLNAYFALMRGDTEAEDGDRAREEYMAAWVREAVSRAGDRHVLVVTGGFHQPALRALASASATNKGWPAVPEPPADAIGGSFLVPYSFARLDSFTGYQSGMPSPAFYQDVWEHGAEEAGKRLAQSVTARLRGRGQPVSTADLIAARTLTDGLAALRGNATPTRTDVLDALATTLISDALDQPLPWTRRGPLLPGAHPAVVEMVATGTGERTGSLHPDTPVPPLVVDVEERLATLGVELTAPVELDLAKVDPSGVGDTPGAAPELTTALPLRADAAATSTQESGRPPLAEAQTDEPVPSDGDAPSAPSGTPGVETAVGGLRSESLEPGQVGGEPIETDTADTRQGAGSPGQRPLATTATNVPVAREPAPPTQAAPTTREGTRSSAPSAEPGPTVGLALPARPPESAGHGTATASPATDATSPSPGPSPTAGTTPRAAQPTHPTESAGHGATAPPARPDVAVGGLVPSEADGARMPNAAGALGTSAGQAGHADGEPTEPGAQGLLVESGGSPAHSPDAGDVSRRSSGPLADSSTAPSVEPASSSGSTARSPGVESAAKSLSASDGFVSAAVPAHAPADPRDTVAMPSTTPTSPVKPGSPASGLVSTPGPLAASGGSPTLSPNTLVPSAPSSSLPTPPPSLDLLRSRLLHSLRVLGVPGHQRVEGSGLVVRERWEPSGTAGREAALVEAGAYGAGLDEAVAAVLDRRCREARAEPRELAGVLLDAVQCGVGATAEQVVTALAEQVRRVRDVGALGDVLGVALDLWRHDRIYHVAGDPMLAAVIGRCVARVLWLVDGAHGGRGVDAARLGALCGVRDALRHAPEVLPVRPDAVLAAAQRIAADSRAPADLRGAMTGLAWVLGDPGDVPAALRAAAAPESLGDWLAGLFALARREVAGAGDDGVLRALDSLVAAFTDDDFLVALPALRQAFAYFPPRERERIAERLLAARALRGSARGLLRLPADPLVLARAAALEADVARVLDRHGLRSGQ
ncbi:DUF5682 family protein [Yinghuangia seranimata]|uniref:DUF5682 family protein n=1 Tax=Yinghuangia seranimata TaxID=408067 RepID=UPI00248AD1C9|nr:DUF5682 family protein [Yinghuangia seranimata]MDI2129631.1 DUF5682 family protein [Yinghuangia seranimata]